MNLENSYDGSKKDEMNEGFYDNKNRWNFNLDLKGKLDMNNSLELHPSYSRHLGKTQLESGVRSTRHSKNDLRILKQQQFLREQNLSKTGRAKMTEPVSVLFGDSASANLNPQQRSRLVLQSRSTIQGGTFDFSADASNNFN